MRIDARYHNGNTRLRALIDNPVQTPTRQAGSAKPSATGNSAAGKSASVGQDSAGCSTAGSAPNVQSLIIRYQQEVVVDARLSVAIARYPYFSFEFTGGNVGEELTVEWVDSADNQSISTVLIG